MSDSLSPVQADILRSALLLSTAANPLYIHTVAKHRSSVAIWSKMLNIEATFLNSIRSPAFQDLSASHTFYSTTVDKLVQRKCVYLLTITEQDAELSVLKC